MFFRCCLFDNKTIQAFQTNEMLCHKSTGATSRAYMLVLRQYCSSTGLVLLMQGAVCTLAADPPTAPVCHSGDFVFFVSTMGISPSIRIASLRVTAIKIYSLSDIHFLFWGEVETRNIHEKSLQDGANSKTDTHTP